MVGTVPAHVVANQAIQLASLRDFTSSGKFAPSTCRLEAKNPIFRYPIVHLFQRRHGNLTTRTLVFAVPNGSDEFERGGSQACTGDQLKAFENIEDFENLNVEVIAETEFPQSAELAAQGNPFDKLKAVNLHVLALEQWNASRLRLSHRSYMVSATNLIHYLALKCLDIEELNEDLSSLGLLNLDTINQHVLASLTASIQTLKNSKNNTFQNVDRKVKEEFTISAMKKMSSSNKDLLLGPLRDDRNTHIMVTVGQEAISDETLIPDLLKLGTTIFRINCAHGNTSEWSELISRVRMNSQMLEKPSRIIMDLSGPKLRTDKIKAGPNVIKISPKKTAFGSIVFPAHVWLTHKGAGPPPSHLSPDAVLFVDGHDFLNILELGNIVRFSDARGKQRILKISEKFPVFSGVGFLAECCRTAYFQTGTKLYIKGKKSKLGIGRVVDVPAIEQFVRLRVGDLLTISRYSSNKDDESCGPDTHRITCSSGYLFDSVKPGEPIAFDDGKIQGVIQGTSTSEIIVSITRAGLKGTKLGSEKSINIPESNIRFEGLTSKDLMDLEFVAENADMVGVSFVRNVSDIVLLQQELEKRKLRKLGIVLKIEAKGGFEKLPLVLLEAMRSPNPLGVMIARGDLAVECGWEKLADIQEEVLSICGAAHVPVIWATQVLESLVKSGVPTRAEITDVASGTRASCIMLNKGKHILEGVSTLDSILRRNSNKVKPELKPLVPSTNLF